MTSACIRSSRSARRASGPTEVKLRRTCGSKGDPRDAPRRSARRTSPSERSPTSRPPASTTSARPTPPPSMTEMPSISLFERGTQHFSICLIIVGSGRAPLGVLHPDRMLQLPFPAFLLPQVRGAVFIAQPQKVLGLDPEVFQAFLEIAIREFAVELLDERHPFLPREVLVPDLLGGIVGRPPESEL